MTIRFCSRCHAEVEDAGGYCLLGHDLRLEAPVDSLTALRAEVNRTFDEARQQLADVMVPAATAPVIVTPPVRTTAPTSAPAPVARPSRFVPPPPSVQLDDYEEDQATDERPTATAAANHHSPHTVWDDLDDGPLAPGDPITSFAPEPRMDWGPRKGRFLRKRSRAPQLQPDA